MPRKQPYTVLIRVPDTVDSDRPVYLMLVNATSARRAWQATKQGLVEDLELGDIELDAEDDLFECVALFRGHHKNFAHLVEEG